MKRTIQIGNKYTQLMEYYDEQYDKEEFNIFISKLLLANKDLEDRHIDLIFLADLIKKYELDYYSLMNLIMTNEKVGVPSIATNNNNNYNDKVEKAKPLINIKEQKKENKTKKESNPILDLGIDLS